MEQGKVTLRRRKKGALGSAPQSKHARDAKKTSRSGKTEKAIVLPPNLPPSILPSKKNGGISSDENSEDTADDSSSSPFAL